MDPIVPFDLQRMFVGDQPPLFFFEIVVRIVLIYLFAVVALSMMGKRGRREMSPFEYMIIIALGSAVGDSMFYPEVPLLYAFLVILVLMLLVKLMERLQLHSRWVHKGVEGVPALLVRDGKILHEFLRREGMTPSALYSMLREEGIDNVGVVRYAFLELSGELGVIRFPEGKEREGVSTLQEVDAG